MATDCYAKFKSAYSQARADGFSEAVAIAAAQSAMDACLSQQNSRPSTIADPTIVIDSGRTVDKGPVAQPANSTQQPQ